MGSTAIIRGFKVSVAALDAFLAAHNVDETYGAPPFYADHPDGDKISKLFFSKVSQHDPNADKNRFRVLIPWIRAMSGRPKTAYVAYTWAAVEAHREIRLDEDIPAAIPVGFEELRREILAYGRDVEEGIVDEGKMGVYLVVTYEIRGYYKEGWAAAEGL
ncbi:hypothetical protein OQA88_13342 [Cercophora sp. LCS_1]